MLTSPNALIENGTLKNGLLPALKSYLFLKMRFDTMTPIFEELCQQAIASFKPVIEEREIYTRSSRPSPAGKPVTRWSSLYLTDEKTALKMYAWHKEEMAKVGYSVEGEHRSAYAVAEDLLIKTENLLIHEMEPFTHVELSQLYKLDTRKKYLDLVVGLLVKLATDHDIELNIIAELSDKKRA